LSRRSSADRLPPDSSTLLPPRLRRLISACTSERASMREVVTLMPEPEYPACAAASNGRKPCARAAAYACILPFRAIRGAPRGSEIQFDRIVTNFQWGEKVARG